MSNGLTLNYAIFFYEIFRIDAKWLENRVYKISWKSPKNWLIGYRKANFHFGSASTVGQTKVFKLLGNLYFFIIINIASEGLSGANIIFYYSV